MSDAEAYENMRRQAKQKADREVERLDDAVKLHQATTEIPATPNACPLCGGEAKVLKWAFHGFDNSRSIQCTNTDCRIESRPFRTAEDAIAAWNKRVKSPAARHVTEKIRNAIRAGMTIDVFGAKRLTGVVLDLEAAEEFVKEVGDGA